MSASTPSETSAAIALPDGLLVDRFDDRTVCADPLGHLVHVARVRQRLRLLVHHEPEQRAGRPRLGEVQDVPETLRDDEADEGAAPLEHGVGRDGRPVEDRVELAELDVLPWRRRAECPRSRPTDWSSGVLGVFASQTRCRSLSWRRTSVNVPPTSTPRR